MSVLPLACLFLAMASGQASAAAGRLDQTFGSGGTVLYRGGGGEDLALLADGRIVTVGGTNDRFAISVLDIDGDLDATFGHDGTVTTTFLRDDVCGSAAEAVVVQPDGKTVAAGYTYCSTGARSRFALARYGPHGHLDPTFGGDGRVMTRFGERCASLAWAAALQTNGKIVVVGQTFCDGGRFAVARYDADGSLDATFSGDGLRTTDFSSFGDQATDVAIQPDGKIVVSGAAVLERNHARFALARYDRHGRLDPTLGADGKVTTKFGGCPANASALALQDDGKIVAAGWAGCLPQFALARYTPGGRLDETFSGDGRITTLIGPCGDQANAVVVQSDGRIVAGGWAACDEAADDTSFALARYRRSGHLDVTFGGDGKVTTRISPGDFFEQVSALAIDADGRIVAGGATESLPAVARYLSS